MVEKSAYMGGMGGGRGEREGGGGGEGRGLMEEGDFLHSELVQNASCAYSASSAHYLTPTRHCSLGSFPPSVGYQSSRSESLAMPSDRTNSSIRCCSPPRGCESRIGRHSMQHKLLPLSCIYSMFQPSVVPHVSCFSHLCSRNFCAKRSQKRQQRIFTFHAASLVLLMFSFTMLLHPVECQVNHQEGNSVLLMPFATLLCFAL